MKVFSTGFLVIVHMIIFLIWLTQWEWLVTLPGMIVWGSATIGGVLYFAILYRQELRGIKHPMQKTMLFISTGGMLALVFLSLVIEGIQHSMP